LRDRLIGSGGFLDLNRAALQLFPSVEDALEFLEDYYMDDARAELLTQLGRISDAAQIHAKNRDMLKAAETLDTPATLSLDQLQLTAKCILTGLQQSLTLGVPPESSSIASKLLVLADRLDESAMKGRDVHEVSPPIRSIGRRV